MMIMTMMTTMVTMMMTLVRMMTMTRKALVSTRGHSYLKGTITLARAHMQSYLAPNIIMMRIGMVAILRIGIRRRRRKF